MTREILSIDFYGNEIIAALVALDDNTDTLRLRHILRKPCKAFAGAFVRDMQGAAEELSAIFEDMAEHTSNALSVIVGLRGQLLSFKRASGFESISSRNRLVGTRDIEAALHNSIPLNLNESLEVVDVLPQSYTIDGNTGIINPRGMSGCTLEVETFLSLAQGTHLKTLADVFKACSCTEFQLLPTALAASHVLLTDEEKQAGTLFLDIGQAHTSAVMYHKGYLVEAWELALGSNCLAAAVADLLQNDLDTAQEVLKTYEPGTDEIVDEVLEEANLKMLQNIKKELLQSLLYLQHPSSQLVLCGASAQKALLKPCKKIFGVRKAHLAQADELFTDCAGAEHPVFAGVLAMVHHALLREEQELGIVQTKPAGLIDNLLEKFGLSEIF